MKVARLDVFIGKVFLLLLVIYLIDRAIRNTKTIEGATFPYGINNKDDDSDDDEPVEEDDEPVGEDVDTKEDPLSKQMESLLKKFKKELALKKNRKKYQKKINKIIELIDLSMLSMIVNSSAIGEVVGKKEIIEMKAYKDAIRDINIS